MYSFIFLSNYLGLDATGSGQTCLNYYLLHIKTIHISSNRFIQITNVKMQDLQRDTQKDITSIKTFDLIREISAHFLTYSDDAMWNIFL